MKVLISALFVLALGVFGSAQACEYMNKLTQLTDQQKVTEGKSPVPADTKQPLVVINTEKKAEAAN